MYIHLHMHTVVRSPSIHPPNISVLVPRKPPPPLSSLLGSDLLVLEVRPGCGSGKTIGKPWENHRKTTGKSQENCGFMGFDGIYPPVMTKSLPLKPWP